MFGGGSSHKADIDAVDIVLDLHGKWKPWDIPPQWKSASFNQPLIIDMYIADQTAPYWVGKPFWQALWGDLKDEAQRRGGTVKVLVACMGGHGRTGTVLTALAVAARALPKKADPIAWVRDHYCNHAVESQSQVKYLESTFGFTTTETPYKTYKPVTAAAPTASATKPTGGVTKGAHPSADLLDMYDYLNGGV